MRGAKKPSKKFQIQLHNGQRRASSVGQEYALGSTTQGDSLRPHTEWEALAQVHPWRWELASAIRQFEANMCALGPQNMLKPKTCRTANAMSVSPAARFCAVSGTPAFSCAGVALRKCPTRPAYMNMDKCPALIHLTNVQSKRKPVMKSTLR